LYEDDLDDNKKVVSTIGFYDT
jgi:hypothetical protein